MLHYNRGRQDMDTRRTRKNGWNDIWRAYMSKLPSNWPYNSVVTVPLLRTTILEKTARLLNAKLQGRLVPREGGDMVKAKIQNTLLDFQWDNANTGGSMIEKVALADQVNRVYGAAFAYIYWDNDRNTNEMKICDPRDISFDGSATHIRNARWVQYREFTTVDVLETRGYDVSKLKDLIKKGGMSDERQDSSYESIVKANRGLENRVGEKDDPTNPVLEVVTEWNYEDNTYSIFLPRDGQVIVANKPNPYKHGMLPFAMLRYYPIGDDIYGESEVEPVIGLQRTANALLCGFVDEMNISMRPPLKVAATGVRIDTIEYGPGARWIMTSPNLVEEMRIGGQTIQNFTSTFPVILSMFNTAMGDQSLGTSNVTQTFSQKTATEVKDLAAQQNNRDQYNQLYLSEFLKDIMMMWVSNNKQYLFDDPTKHYHIIKVIGKDNIREFQQMNLDGTDVPDYALKEIMATVEQNPDSISPEQLDQIMQDVAVPINPVVMNPDEKNPDNYEIKKKLHVSDNGTEAELYLQREDFDGVYDYIPDVTSMSSGASANLKSSRQVALTTALNPTVQQMLAAQGETMNIKDLLIQSFEDAGMKDAEGLFVTSQQLPVAPQQPNGQQPPIGGGQTAPQAGQQPPTASGSFGMEGVSSAVPIEPSAI